MFVTRPPRRQKLPILATALVALGSTALAQVQLFESTGSPGDYYGRDMDRIGDLDQDGVDDLLIGSNSGRVVARSGATHAVIHDVGPPGGVDPDFGFSVASVGDLDGDGTEDLVTSGTYGPFLVSGAAGQINWSAILAIHDQMKNQVLDGAGDVDGDGFPDVLMGTRTFGVGTLGTLRPGRVWLLSGTTGQPIYTVDGTSGSFEQLGSAVSFGGDVNQDGTPDWIAGLPGFSATASYQGGRVQVCSGVDGTVQQFHDGTVYKEMLGHGVSGGVDLDGDGTPDYAASSYRGLPSTTASYQSGVAVYSGSTGVRYWEVPLDSIYDVELLPDLDADGRGDLAVGGLEVLGMSAAAVYSGRTHHQLAVYVAASQPIGSARITGLGDVNGDGLADVAVSDISYGGYPYVGRVRVYPGVSTPLDVDPAPVSLLQGGTRELTLNLDAPTAGLWYLMLGSYSGTQSGLPWAPGQLLPLTPDPYFSFTLQNPNSALLSSSLGMLDGNGVGVASFNVPAGSNPVFAGLEVHHAAAVISTLGVRQVTGAVAISLAP